MTIPKYGVLKAQPISSSRGPTHFHIRAVASGVHYRISVNVNSQQPPSELRYVVLCPFADPLTQALARLPVGVTPIARSANGLALDFVRRPLFAPRSLRLLPANRPGPDNDLSDLLGTLIARAARERNGVVYAFGSCWGPERRTPDRVFGFTPGNGVHNVHMNQGNHPRFEDDDGTWQDGGLIVQFATAPEWAAVFLAFQSQAWRTDDRTGHAMRRAST